MDCKRLGGEGIPMSEPEEKPFGESAYGNYDPEQVNNAQDVVELFRWIGNENRNQEDHTAATVFHECADAVERSLIKND